MSALLAVALVVALGMAPAPALPTPACPAEIVAAPWPADEACAVSFCESRWQADAGETNRGLFQIWVGWADYYHIDRASLYDRQTNISVAYLIWRDHGRWSAWSCFPEGQPSPQGLTSIRTMR